MLITQEVSIICRPNNRKYYQPKGYAWKYNKPILVKVNDLSPNSIELITTICDFCGKEIHIKYQDYRIRKENQDIKKDCCYECKGNKVKLKYEELNKNKLLTKNDIGYWSSKENRLKEIKLWIEKYGTVNNLKQNKDGIQIFNNLSNFKESPMILAIELGYDIKDISKHSPPHYYEDWELFEPKLIEVINKLGRFPTISEFNKQTGISSRYINYHGGIYNIKRKLGYIDGNDLVDDSGYYNMSSYEYILSQWILNNTNIQYNRNVIISPTPEIDGYYNCDYVLNLDNGEKLWIEIWGMYDNIKYKERHDIKLKLYEKYNHDIISLYPDFFLGIKYDLLQQNLKDLFLNHFKIISNKISNEKIIPYCLLSKDDFISKILKYCKDGYLPERNKFYSNNSKLLKEIEKRFDSYSNFSKEINIPMLYKANNFWTEEEILNYFDFIHNDFGKILNREEILENKITNKFCDDLTGIIAVIHRYGGMVNLKIKYYANNINKLTELDIKDIKKIINSKGTKRITLLNKQQAQEILTKYNNQQNVVL